jgi:hypothetical protein
MWDLMRGIISTPNLLGMAITVLISFLLLVYFWDRRTHVTNHAFLMGSTGAILSGTSIANGIHVCCHGFDKALYPTKDNEFYVFVSGICLIVVAIIVMSPLIRSICFWHKSNIGWYKSANGWPSGILRCGFTGLISAICLMWISDVAKIIRLSWKTGAPIPDYYNPYLFVGGAMVVMASMHFISEALQGAASTMTAEYGDHQSTLKKYLQKKLFVST